MKRSTSARFARLVACASLISCGSERPTGEGHAASIEEPARSFSAVLVKDLVPGAFGSEPEQLVDIGGTLLFAASAPAPQGNVGFELWKWSGRDGKVSLVKDVNPNGGAGIEGLTRCGAAAYFIATDGTHGRELWRSDGTAAGTVMLKDILVGATGSEPRSLTAVNDVLFFTATDASGFGLWKSNGTEAGTELVRSFGTVAPGELTAVGGVLYFRVDDGTNGTELWKSDGTLAGTMMVKDINPAGDSTPRELTAVSGTLFFFAGDGTDISLWKSDGTLAGTTIVHTASFGLGSHSPMALGNALLFFFNGNLFRSDGTVTQIVKQVGIGGVTTDRHRQVVVNGVMLFDGFATFGADTTGDELWRTDGTTNGTVLVADVNAGSAGSAPFELTNVNGTVFFSAYTQDLGVELWKSDGTTIGTTLVQNIRPFDDNSTPLWLTNFNGTLVFTADDGSRGIELWKTRPRVR